MTRMSKQGERRSVSPRRPRPPSVKTGPRKDNLPKGYREHPNALAGTEWEGSFYIPKLKTR